MELIFSHESDRPYQWSRVVWRNERFRVVMTVYANDSVWVGGTICEGDKVLGKIHLVVDSYQEGLTLIHKEPDAFLMEVLL